MKDYERLHRACVILNAYVEEKNRSDYNLNPQHDMIYLCFDANKDDISESDQKELASLKVHYEGSQMWYMHISC